MRALEGVDAGAFAVVMATGIVGVGARLEELAPLADVLLAIACIVWVALVSVLRMHSVRSFALVAGTAVIGADFVLAGQEELALALWALATALWVAVAFTIRTEAAGSLLTIVATESLAVLAAALDRHGDAPLRVPAVALWALGLALYPVVAGRIVHGALRESRFDPTMWIVMGALSITTLAASELLLDHGALGSAVAVATWAAASTTMPFLILTELRARQWRYEVARWSFVFPLGMYGVASHVLGSADALDGLRTVGTVFFWIALAAWLVTAGGLVRRT